MPHLNSLLKESSLALIVRLVGIAATMILSIIIGRQMGAQGTGFIGLPNRVIAVFTVFASLGMNQTLVKRIAEIRSPGYYKALISCALRPAMFIATVAMIGIFVSADFISVKVLGESSYALPFRILSIGLVFQVAARVYAAALNGTHHIWQSNLVNNSLSNVIVLCALLTLLALNHELDLTHVLSIMVLGRALMMFIVARYWHRVVGNMDEHRIDYPPTRSGELIMHSRPLFTTAITIILLENSFVFLLSVFNSAESVGIFSVCARVTLIFTLVLQVVNSTMAPVIAQTYASNDKQRLQQSLKSVSRLLFAGGLLSFGIVVVAGHEILGLWGDDFRLGYVPLVIMSIGQVLNLFSGLSGNALVMMGFNKMRRNIGLVAIGVALISSLSLIPAHGVVGAAWAFTITMTIENALKAFCVQRATGIKSYFYG